jgi:hypothetical protein
MTKDIITRALVVIAATAAVSCLARRALKSRAAVSTDGSQVLQYPMLLRSFGTIGSVMLVVLVAFIPTMLKGEAQTPFGIGLFTIIGLGLGFLGVYGTLEFPLVRLEVRNDGLLSRTPWRRRRFIAWTDIASVSYSSGAQWFVIRAQNGASIRAHLYLSGIRELYDELRHRLPANAWRNLYAPFEELSSGTPDDV